MSRDRRGLKRDTGAALVPLEEAMTATSDRPPDLVALDLALQALARIDDRKSVRPNI